MKISTTTHVSVGVDLAPEEQFTLTRDGGAFRFYQLAMSVGDERIEAMGAPADEPADPRLSPSKTLATALDFQEVPQAILAAIAAAPIEAPGVEHSWHLLAAAGLIEALTEDPRKPGTVVRDRDGVLWRRGPSGPGGDPSANLWAPLSPEGVEPLAWYRLLIQRGPVTRSGPLRLVEDDQQS